LYLKGFVRPVAPFNIVNLKQRVAINYNPADLRLA